MSNEICASFAPVLLVPTGVSSRQMPTKLAELNCARPRKVNVPWPGVPMEVTTSPEM